VHQLVNKRLSYIVLLINFDKKNSKRYILGFADLIHAYNREFREMELFLSTCGLCRKENVKFKKW